VFRPLNAPAALREPLISPARLRTRRQAANVENLAIYRNPKPIVSLLSTPIVRPIRDARHCSPLLTSDNARTRCTSHEIRKRRSDAVPGVLQKTLALSANTMTFARYKFVRNNVWGCGTGVLAAVRSPAPNRRGFHIRRRDELLVSVTVAMHKDGTRHTIAVTLRNNNNNNMSVVD
jgi:hypothetical protein